MKTLQFFSLAAVTLLFILTSCGGGKVKPAAGISQGRLDSASYSVGMWLGQSFDQAVKNSGIGELNMSQVMKGLNDQINSKAKFDESEIFEIINNYVGIKSMAEAEYNLKEAEKFLAENKNKAGVVTLESGLQYKVLQEGNGIFPTSDDTVEVYYTGTYLDGEVFDSTDKSGSSATFPLDGVIPGWIEGIPYISEGGKIMLYIPSELGYGENARYYGIKLNSVLVFEIELLRVIRAETIE